MSVICINQAYPCRLSGDVALSVARGGYIPTKSRTTPDKILITHSNQIEKYLTGLQHEHGLSLGIAVELKTFCSHRLN